MTAHATGRWAKTIRGRFHYFGPWDDPDAALAKYLAEKDYLHTWTRPPDDLDGLTIRHLANRFCTWKRHLLVTGEPSQRTFTGYYSTSESLCEVFTQERPVSDLTADELRV
jgi:hypothetical protein